jgi:hypothetical protein
MGGDRIGITNQTPQGLTILTPNPWAVCKAFSDDLSEMLKLAVFYTVADTPA